MTAPNREAVEAAAQAIRLSSIRDPTLLAQSALAAALPFLAPQPNGSDDERARDLYRDLANMIVRYCTDKAATARILTFAAAVRAEATLAVDAEIKRREADRFELVKEKAAMGAQIAALRDRVEKLETALRREKFAHGEFPTQARQEAHARIDAALEMSHK